MDSLTQAALGAAIGEAILGRNIGQKGAVLGALVATIPDLDILLTPLYSPLARISIHRGYSHSILFCIAGALLLTYFLGRVKCTKELRPLVLWIFSFVTLFTHVLLDAFTTYGTQLFLPFTDWRVSFDSINVVDPIYTLPLLIGLFTALYIYTNTPVKRARSNYMGLIISTIYLLFTVSNKQNVVTSLKEQLSEQGIESVDILTVPVGIANINWYGVAKTTTHLHLGKYSILEKNIIDFQSFPINDQLLEGLDSRLVDRMKWFAKGLYTVAKKEGKIRLYNMQCDMQGVRTIGDYRAPTAFYFEIDPHLDGSYDLSTGMHLK